MHWFRVLELLLFLVLLEGDCRLYCHSGHNGVCLGHTVVALTLFLRIQYLIEPEIKRFSKAKPEKSSKKEKGKKSHQRFRKRHGLHGPSLEFAVDGQHHCDYGDCDCQRNHVHQHIELCGQADMTDACVSKLLQIESIDLPPLFPRSHLNCIAPV